MTQEKQKKSLLCHPIVEKTSRHISRGVVGGGLVAMAFALWVVSLSVFASSDTSQRLAAVNIVNSVNNVAAQVVQTSQIKSVGEVAGGIIQVVLGILGIIFVILIIYAGFRWMTAMGDDNDIKAARSILYQSIIGLIITISANALTYWILLKVAESVQ